jgi:hypothetical protein
MQRGVFKHTLKLQFWADTEMFVSNPVMSASRTPLPGKRG